MSDIGSPTPRRGNSSDQNQAEALLRRAIDVIESARPMPLSSDSRINKEEVLELLQESLDRLPDELRSARWLLRERDEFLAKVRREGDEILELARARAERTVERTEIVRAAEQRARGIVEAAESDARRMRHEVEDFCDRKLGSFEVVLQKTLKLVGQGRARMQGVPVATPEGALLEHTGPHRVAESPRPSDDPRPAESARSDAARLDSPRPESPRPEAPQAGEATEGAPFFDQDQS